MPSLKRLVGLIVAVFLLALLFSTYNRLVAYQNSFDRREVMIAGSIPAQVYLPAAQNSPIVVVAHGFTADKEMMQRFYEFVEKFDKEYLNSVRLRNSYEEQLKRLRGEK